MRNPVELVKRLVLDQERSAFASLRFDFDPKTQSVRQLFFKGERIGILRGFGPVSYTHLTLPTNREV